jgi:hypothetical protein
MRSCAAKFKDRLLYNRYQSGRDTFRKYENEPAYAYFISEGAPTRWRRSSS